jgi:hypothetical protein
VTEDKAIAGVVLAVCPKTGLHEADPKRMSWKVILAISRKRWVSKSNERESCGRIAVPGSSLTFLHFAMPKDKNEYGFGWSDGAKNPQESRDS